MKRRVFVSFERAWTFLPRREREKKKKKKKRGVSHPFEPRREREKNEKKMIFPRERERERNAYLHGGV